MIDADPTAIALAQVMYIFVENGGSIEAVTRHILEALPDEGLSALKGVIQGHCGTSNAEKQPIWKTCEQILTTFMTNQSEPQKSHSPAVKSKPQLPSWSYHTATHASVQKRLEDEKLSLIFAESRGQQRNVETSTRIIQDILVELDSLQAEMSVKQRVGRFSCRLGGLGFGQG